MSTIRFIIQGSPDTAADTAYELQQYLRAEWQVEAEAKSADTYTHNSADAKTKAFGLDPESMSILLEAAGFYTIAKEVIDGAAGALETKENLGKLLRKITEKMEPILTSNHEYLWFEINGISYPVKADNLDEIIEAIQKAQE